MIHVRYFARLREAFALASESMPVPDGATVSQLMDELKARGGVWADELSGMRPLRVAVNQEMATFETPLNDGDEVALFPPVTGG
jgi:molybdopterin synthase sulfur carrier subunit